MILYDCEIKHIIEPMIERRGLVFQYADSWTDYKGMGVACICAYDYQYDEYRIFTEDNMLDFTKLVNGADCIIGFNNHSFDDNLCNGNDIPIPADKSRDLLQCIWAANGLGSTFMRSTHAGFSLDNMVKVNLPNMKMKSLSGASIPALYQVGKIGMVLDYCLHDVKMLKGLVDKVMLDGFLVNPKNMNRFEIKL